MTYFSMVVCAIVLSVVGLCVSGVIIFYLAKDKHQSNKNTGFSGSRNSLKSVNEDFLRWLRQIEMSFGKIIETIEKERAIISAQNIENAPKKKSEKLVGTMQRRVFQRICYC